MQRRHAQQNHLDCQGWVDSPSQLTIGDWVNGYHDKLFKLLHQFLRVVSNALIVDIHYNAHYSHRMTKRFVHVLRELAIHVERNWQSWAKKACMMIDERVFVRSQALEQGRRLDNEENNIDGKIARVGLSSFHGLKEAVPQSRGTIMTNWRLHIQLCAPGTWDESTYCILIQGLSISNSRKSHDMTNCRSTTIFHFLNVNYFINEPSKVGLTVQRACIFVCKAEVCARYSKKITAWLLLMIKFNEMNIMSL